MSFPIYPKQHEPHNVPLLVGGKAGFRLGRRAHGVVVVVVVVEAGPALGERSYRLIGAAQEQR